MSRTEKRMEVEFITKEQTIRDYKQRRLRFSEMQNKILGIRKNTTDFSVRLL